MLLAGGIGLIAAHRLSHGQPAASMRRVGLLSFSSEGANARVRAAFTQGMNDLGWTEGKNVEYRLAYADGAVDRLDALAVELIGQKAEVIVVSSPQAARAAQRATMTVPIVMAGAANAVGAGFVASLARPGGNITGITSLQEEVLGKLIGVLHEVVPGARRIAILLNESNPSHVDFWTGAQGACAALKLVAQRVVASAPAQLGAAVEQIVRQQSQAVVVVSDGMYYAERAKL
jgi:putative ABC transport system substrate-binding protein